MNETPCDEILPIAENDPSANFPPFIDKTPDDTTTTTTLASTDEPTPKLKPMLKNAGRAFSEDTHTAITDMMGIKDCSRRSMVDELLFDIYDRWHYGRSLSFDSDTFTECSSTSDAFGGRHGVVHSQLEEQNRGSRLNRSYLNTKGRGCLIMFMYFIVHSLFYMYMM